MPREIDVKAMAEGLRWAKEFNRPGGIKAMFEEELARVVREREARETESLRLRWEHKRRVALTDAAAEVVN